MSKIDLPNIKKDILTEGYLWLSDSPDPIVDIATIKEQLSRTDDLSNPFIVEGQLYAEKEGISYSIKYVDGKHFVAEYKLNELGEVYDRKTFVANRITGKDKICFRQYWKEPEDGDPMCENMKALLPDAFVFVGFDKEEEKI